MPTGQLTILPREVRLGELLGRGLGEGIKGATEGYLSRQEEERKRQRAELFSQLMGGVPAPSEQPPLAAAVPSPSELSPDGAVPGPSELSPDGAVPQEVLAAAPQAAPLSRDQLLRFAAESGYSPSELAALEKVYGARAKEDIQREGLRIREEAPERKVVVEEAKKIRDRARTATQKIADYKALKKLSESGELRTGKGRQVLDRFGLAGFWQEPASDVAQKLLGDINLASLSDVTTPGKATAQMLQEISKTNPSLLMTDEGIRYTADMRIISEKIQKQLNAELNKIKKEAAGRPLPLDAVDRAIDRAEPKIKKLHQKQLDLVKKISAQEQEFKSPPPANQFIGKKMINDATGEIVVSDGTRWIPAQ